jgi:hypothetical protein
MSAGTGLGAELAEDVERERREAEHGGAPAREFRFSAAFALAFSDISPIVGIYSVFAISIVLAGPGFFWALALALVLAGQLLVTAVFGDLVSRWPYQGSVYAWSRELIGGRDDQHRVAAPPQQRVVSELGHHPDQRDTGHHRAERSTRGCSATPIVTGPPSMSHPRRSCRNRRR